MNFAAVCMFHVCKCLFGKTLRIRCLRSLLSASLWLTPWKIQKSVRMLNELVLELFFRCLLCLPKWFFREFFSSPRFNIKNLFINKTQKFFFSFSARDSSENDEFLLISQLAPDYELILRARMLLMSSRVHLGSSLTVYTLSSTSRMRVFMNSFDSRLNG